MRAGIRIEPDWACGLREIQRENPDKQGLSALYPYFRNRENLLSPYEIPYDRSSSLQVYYIVNVE